VVIATTPTGRETQLGFGVALAVAAVLLTLGGSLRIQREQRARTVKAVYDDRAARYDRFRELWLRWAGTNAEAAMLADARPLLRPGARVLDAGAGTGARARRLSQSNRNSTLRSWTSPSACSRKRRSCRRVA